MKRVLVVFTLFSLLAGTAATAQKTDTSAAEPGTVEARLEAVSRVVMAGAQARLTLKVSVLEETELDATVLQGVHLEVKTADGETRTIGGPEPGTVKVAAGTVIERSLRVDLQVQGDMKSGTLPRVSVTWPGLPGATASLQVAPDTSNIAIDQLDLSKTRVMLVTSLGAMTLEFFPDKAPNHVRNFIELAKSGFYDGTKFHRVIRGFMIQGGCPNTKEGATGMPGTGSRPDGKTVDAEFNDMRHVRGVLSAARTADPNSHSCQFFICHGSPSHLDGQYTAFGRLVSGDATLEKIASVECTGPARSTPVNPVHLYSAVVLPVLTQN